MRSEDGFLLYDANEFAQYLASFLFTRPIARVQNHHTWIPNYSHFKGDNHFSLLRAMKRSHVQDRGWSDIGQNITTFPDGTVAVCRPLNSVPACIKGANTGSIGMEHVGNFDSGGDTMTPAHASIIVQVNALFCKKMKLVPDTDTIVYHHWYDLNTGKRTNGSGVTKSCPGTAFWGGNSVENARSEFIPKVKNAMENSMGVATSTAQAPQSGVVNVDVLNVRDRPSTTGAVLRKLRRNDPVGVFARSAAYGSMEWLKIDASAEEWVAAPFVT